MARWFISWSKDSLVFIDDFKLFRAVKPTQVGKKFSACLYHLTKTTDNSNIMCRNGVSHTNGLAPPLSEIDNIVFHQNFDIGFDLNLNKSKHVRSSLSGKCIRDTCRLEARKECI